MEKRTIRDIDVDGKKVLVRVDFNVPISGEGKVSDDTRLRAALPTINYLLSRRAKVILASHLGRPEGVEDKYRLDPVAKALSNLLNRKVAKVDETVGDEVQAQINRLDGDGVLLLENLRFNPGEKANDPDFAKQLASLADVYVDDAFGTAHRAHASVVGVANYLPAVGGLLLEKEIKTLDNLLHNPARPFCAILGGNKVSDKIGVIAKFLELVDCLLTGGGMCFTFLKAKGLNVGKSICQEEELEHASNMLLKAEQKGVRFYLPVDVVVAPELADGVTYRVVPVEEIPAGWMGLDIGPKTIEIYREVIEQAKTIFWNGPVGAFEWKPFSNGTREIAHAIASSSGTTIVGGGDSDAALRKYGVENKISFVSTGGGASLKFLEGTSLPGIEALLDK